MASGRSRPWAAQSAASPDARDQATAVGGHDRRLARIRTEPTARTLRTRHRTRTARPTPRSVRQARGLHLSRPLAAHRDLPCLSIDQRNSAIKSVARVFALLLLSPARRGWRMIVGLDILAAAALCLWGAANVLVAGRPRLARAVPRSSAIHRAADLHGVRRAAGDGRCGGGRTERHLQQHRNEAARPSQVRCRAVAGRAPGRARRPTARRHRRPLRPGRVAASRPQDAL